MLFRDETSCKKIQGHVRVETTMLESQSYLILKQNSEVQQTQSKQNQAKKRKTEARKHGNKSAEMMMGLRPQGRRLGLSPGRKLKTTHRNPFHKAIAALNGKNEGTHAR